jgi:beta-aspartyl-peptidase (threonine type)
MRSDFLPAIVVHGGAGALAPEDPATSGAADRQRLLGVRSAAEAGWAVLRAGGGALDAVEAAVRALEDDPSFNAGTGAVLTAAGDVELDAAIMDGATLRCGAVAVVKDVKNPVSLARAVMERSGHVLLAGPGASAFAREVGIPSCENSELVVPARRAQWEAAVRTAIPLPPGTQTGTVGAVARDAAGHLAAATSTGGTSMKRPGRVGDTPLIGCGTYADDRLAAASCTGNGERMIQLTLARHAADLAGGGMSAMEAANAAVRLLGPRPGGSGGLILVGPAGEVGFAHDTPVMTRAWTTPDGKIHVAP